MNRGIVILIGVILFILLCIICIRCHADKIESKLAYRSVLSLEAAGLEGASVIFDGRNAILSGEMGSAIDSENAKSLIRSISGVRSVTNNLTVKKSDLTIIEKPEEVEVKIAEEPEIDISSILSESTVLFETDSDKLSPGAIALLNKLAEILKEDTQAHIEIAGHTDNRGGLAYNQALSVQRAKSVQKFLISSGIPGTRLKITGYGETKPIADNTQIEGMAKNRRVEFRVAKED